MDNRNEKRVEIPVMHCFDNNYVIPAAVSFYSMLKYADPQYIYKLFVLHSDITVQNQKMLTELVNQYSNASLEFIDMNHRFDDVWEKITNSEHLAKEVIYKLIAPEIFPQYDKLIVTDVDVLFLGDISKSYFVLDEHPDAYFAGVRQINPEGTFLRDYYKNYIREFGEEGYRQLKICGGYLVANLKKQREDGIEAGFLDYLQKNAHRLLQLEQDVINFCCKDHQVAYLPLPYVLCSYTYDICTTDAVCCSDPFYSYKEIKDAMANPIQLHYATKTKPWNAPESTKADLWAEYLKKTSFYPEYLKKREAEMSDKMMLPLPQIAKKEEKPRAKVSVLCASYNCEAYIEEALKGILEQKTDFPFEVIVSDDASTDGTQEIIRRYMERYPEQMQKTVLRTENVGIGTNYYEALTKVEGKYFALCDGDDCWTDPCKLQKQVDFLDANPEYTVVCSDFTRHYIGGEDKKDDIFSARSYLKTCNVSDTKLTAATLLKCPFIASCTVMMRWQLRDRVPEFLKKYCIIDYPLNLIHGSYGYIHIMDEVMSKYNVHQSSVTNDGQHDLLQEHKMVEKEVNQLVDYQLLKTSKKKPIFAKIAAPKQAASADSGTSTGPVAAQQQLQPASKKYTGFIGFVHEWYHRFIPLRIRNALFRILH